MRIIFVRHGESDYVHDRLTEEGILQAEATAERLKEEGISGIYSSPNRRAVETAAFTAKSLGLPVSVLGCLRGIVWGGPDIPCGGKPWKLGELMLQDGFDLLGPDWREHPYFEGNMATFCYREITSGFDAFLAKHGYRHDGGRFFCEEGSGQTLAMFSHGSTDGCILAHLLDLPFPYVSYVLQHDPSSLIILDLPVKNGTFVFPKLVLFNDSAHISS